MAVKIIKPSIGELRDVGHFENNINIQPYTAGYIDGYENIITSVYCKLRQRSSRRTNDFGQIEITSFWEMYCRFQNAIESNMLENTKFVQANRRFTIVGFEILDSKNFFYRFTLNLITA